MTGDDELSRELAPRLARRWLLLGVGNDMRGDDGFGPRVARRVAEAGGPALDGGMAPENLTGPIRRAAPEVLLIADAAELGEAPGTVRVLDASELAIGGTSTHDPGLSMLVTFLRAEREMREMEVCLLAAQPAVRGFGEDMTPEVMAAADRVANLLCR